uniref:complement C1r subcomponent-like protein n=1 Tax=Jaculus jaculus TaxID=51337 RepID=UPI001E1B4226|nr:complement C1r subcomponent-like protein [Jaculus jaculus]
MYWLLLWEVFQAGPTWGSVLLAQQLPKQLTSPGYPEPYLKGQESRTHIWAPEGFAVRLVFQDFDLEPSVDCEGDSVTISTGGMDQTQLCGHQGSPLGSPGHREFVSPGRSLQLIFQTHSSSKSKATHLHRGFLAVYQAVAAGNSQTVVQARGTSEAVMTPLADSHNIQNHCQDPYYEVESAGTLSCPAQGTRKDKQNGEEVPRCVPVCGWPVTLVAQSSSRAQPGDFPWQALIYIHGRGGGALLGDRWVLTAAHTVYPKGGAPARGNRSAGVFLGGTEVAELLRLGRRAVRRVVVHPAYRARAPGHFGADLALLELARPAALGPRLRPVCLPRRRRLYRAGREGVVSGFGVDRGRLPAALKFSRLRVAPAGDCRAWLRDRGRREVFSEDMFCARERARPGGGVCQGDSGSVFAVWDELALQWVAAGVVSWGAGCGEGYGFYTKVLNHVDWIEAVMGGGD